MDGRVRRVDARLPRDGHVLSRTACASVRQKAIRGGAQIFKAHIQVGNYDPNNPLLDDVWGLIDDAELPVVIHCGSGPQPGQFTGPRPIRTLLRRYPRLKLIIAHMGMPEYSEFLDLAEEFADVRLIPRLRAMGARILFGSDFPNIPYAYADALRGLIRLEVDDDWLRAVLYHNGAQLFSL
jgi:predicted TIM-barrel fold metal-dependent hydrolase